MSAIDSQNKINPYLADPAVILMLEFQKGDNTSFEKLMVLYYPRILNFINRFVGRRQVAEDLTQEVFIKVYHSAASYKPQSKFQTWIYTIAKNISLNELRKYKNSTVSLDGTFATEDDELKKQWEDLDAKKPGQDLVEEEVVSQIKAAIDELPENQKMAVILLRYEQLSYDEIAATMNLSMQAVKSLLSRAKENLKVKLANLVNE